MLESVKSAAAAAQARLTAAFDASQRAVQAAAGVPLKRRGRGVGAQVALARRQSPNRGNQSLGLARALVQEMPHTLHLMEAGVLNEWRATLLVRETAVLTRRDRGRVDAELAGPDPSGQPAPVTRLGDQAVVDAARATGQRLDPDSALRRWQHGLRERRVTLRPAPGATGCMATLTALLPLTEGVAVYAALTRAADAAKTAPGGDARGHGQIMADTLIHRILTQTSQTSTSTSSSSPASTQPQPQPEPESESGVGSGGRKRRSTRRGPVLGRWPGR